MRLGPCAEFVLVGLIFTVGRALDSAIDELSSEEFDELDLSEEKDIGRFDPVKHSSTSTMNVCNEDKSDFCKCKTEKVKDATVASLNCSRKDRDTSKPLSNPNVKPADPKFKPTYVSFFGNEIEYLEADSLMPESQETITSLDFMHNKINEIDNGAFDKFTSLKKLRLTDNFIKITEDNDDWITEELGKTLEKLYLGYNRIEKLNKDAFAALHKLKTLVLDGNTGIFLSDDTFKTELPELEKLSLDYCALQSLPKNLFKNLPKLKAISLIGNPLTAIPKALNLVNSLEILDLSRTEITEFTKNALKDDHSVKQLYLNKLKYLYELDDCAFCGLTNLEKVDLSEAKHLHILHANAFGNVDNKDESPKALTTLLLSKCNISELPEELVNWGQLNEIGIAGNPLNCDEKLYWLIRDFKILHLSGEVLTCDQPPALQGKSIQNAIVALGDKVAKPAAGFSVFRVFVALVFLAMVAGTVVFGIMFCNRRYGGNPFYRPQMPHVGFNNLSAHLDLDDEFEEEEEERTSTPPPAAV